MKKSTSNNKIKVSVIIPVYNVEKYLDKCLNSVVNQTLNDIEAIVVNDGSPDNSQKIIDDYVKKYPEIIKSYKKTNGGLSDARNFGIKKATGDYLAFLDSDDYISTEMLEKMYNNALETDCKIVVCNIIKHNETTGNFKSNMFIINNEIINIEKTPDSIFKCRSFACNKIYHHTIFEQGFEFPKNQVFEDSALIYNILFSVKKVALINDSLYFYRVNRPGAITTSINNKIFDIFKSCESITNYHKKNNTFNLYYNEIEYLCLNHLFVRIQQLSKAKNKKIAFHYIDNMFLLLDSNFTDWKNNIYFFKKAKNNKTRNIIYKNKMLLKIYLLIPVIIKKIGKKTLKALLNIVKIIKKKSRKDYYINDQRLKELQSIELNILLDVDRVCKKNNLKYYLTEGTLLGAIRHNGFIPWDDDLDIMMPREDYEKFIKVAVTELKDENKLCCYDTIKNYHIPFMKVVTLNNKSFVNKDACSLKSLNGPYIDIFPIDNTENLDLNEQRKTYRKIRKYRDILLVKTRYKINIRTNKRRIFYIMFSPFYTNKYLHSQIYKLSTSDNSNNPKYIINHASSYSYKKEIFPAHALGEGKLINFEGKSLPVPSDSDYILTKIYGDYMTLPPIEKRKSKHSFYDYISNNTELKRTEDNDEQ